MVYHKFMYDNPTSDYLLRFTSLEEAVQGLLDEIPESEWPELLTVAKFQYKKITDQDVEYWKDRTIENLMEMMDEEYGPMDGGGPDISSEMEVVTQHFVKEIVELYRVWMMEEVETIQIPTEAYKNE